MGTLNQHLPEDLLEDLQIAYDLGRNDMTAILRDTLPALYEPSRGYVEAIMEAFYGSLPDDDSVPVDPPREALSLQDRDRCVIALLASRGEGFNLAVHIYMALMDGISPDEIANIILLAGIYAGVNNFSRGLSTEVMTLDALKDMASRGIVDVRGVMGGLRSKFGA